MHASLSTHRTTRTRNRRVQKQRNAQHTLNGFLLLLNLLLDCVVLEFEGENCAETVGDGVEAAGCLVWIQNDEFSEHEVAEGADVVLILEASDDAVVEVEDVDTGEGGLH